MFTKKELTEWADDFKSILFDINICLNNLKILQNEGITKFRVNYLDNYLVLVYQQHFILVIQLTKIFDNNNRTHKRNINKLFNKLQNERMIMDVLNSENQCGTFKNKEEVLEVIKDLRVKVESNAELIKSIINNRDTVFAHTDPVDFFNRIDIDEYTTLVNLGNEIYNTLFGKILGEQFNANFVSKYDLRFIPELIV